MRSTQAIRKKLAEARKKCNELFDAKAGPKKKLDYQYNAGIRDALKWALDNGRS